MRVSARQRHERLLPLVREHGTARVTDLAERLGVSPVTVRPDVETLTRKGLVDRAHGSVSWPRRRTGEAGATGADSAPVLGLLAPSATYYFAEVIHGAHEAAARAGARLILRISDYRPEEDRARAEGLLAAGAEELLIAPGWRGRRDPAEHGGWMGELPVPAVLLEREAELVSPLAALDREAARMDGAGELRIFWSIGLRMVMPGLVAIFLFQFTAIWNNFFLPLVMPSDQRLFPLSLGLYAWNGNTHAEPSYYPSSSPVRSSPSSR
ncbi:DeoR family transcriptional regulator [Streptomyces endophytica]|uniref:DeoR family transcriptional regulator n=1 Tax=Streptomyces endophytica TaxID=2991496 RepID=A0ABY6PAK6_9ACTN|nr:DeoR family transcriptional regulator [Streptomyces endophytica]UZJ30863.1 DeoR family transcriptional regulator [Streptomyces endophytica]